MAQIHELWFNDGNVVFEAGHKQFCLHAGLLSARSDIFYHILEDKSSDVAFGVIRDVDINGRLHIRLPDQSQDVHNFFLALYDIIPGFFEPPPAVVTTEVVLGILKISTTYGVQTLRCRALAHLSTVYPLTLQEWDNRKNGTIQARREVYKSFAFTSTFAAAYTIMTIAKDCHVPWILPAALYDCCGFDLDTIIDYFKECRDVGNWDEDLKDSIILGAHAHMTASAEMLSFLAIATPEDCAHATVCLELRRVCMENTLSLLTSNDPLGIWVEEDWNVYLDGMCSACMDKCKAIHRDERQNFWKNLPKKYGDPHRNWAVLTDLYSKEFTP